MIINNGLALYYIIAISQITSKNLIFDIQSFNLIPYLRVKLPEFDETISLPVNTLINYTFLQPKRSYINKCNQSPMITLPDVKYNIYPCDISLSTGNISLGNFKFYMIDQQSSSIYEQLGFSFAFHTNENSNTLIDHLYSEHMIDKKEFSIEMN